MIPLVSLCSGSLPEDFQPLSASQGIVRRQEVWLVFFCWKKESCSKSLMNGLDLFRFLWSWEVVHQANVFFEKAFLMLFKREEYGCWNHKDSMDPHDTSKNYKNVFLKKKHKQPYSQHKQPYKPPKPLCHPGLEEPGVLSCHRNPLT